MIMMLEPASIYQLLKGPRIAVQKGTNPGNSTQTSELILIRKNCDLCDVVLTTTPSGALPRHLSSRDQEGLIDLLRGTTEGRVGHNSSVPDVVMTTLCPSCGQGICSLLSLGRRVRRMEEELKDKIQTLLNIMRWKEGRKGKGLCDPGSLEPKDEVILIERPLDPDDEDPNKEEEGSIKGEVDVEDPSHYYLHSKDDGDIGYTDGDNDDEFLRKQKEEVMEQEGDISTPCCIDQTMIPVEEMEDLEFTDTDGEEIEEVIQSEVISDGAGICSPVVTRPPEDDPASNNNNGGGGDNLVMDNPGYTSPSREEQDIKQESSDLRVPVMAVEDISMEEKETPNEDQQFLEGLEGSHDEVLTMPQCNNVKEQECSRPRKCKTTTLQKLRSHLIPESSSQWEGDGEGKLMSELPEHNNNQRSKDYNSDLKCGLGVVSSFLNPNKRPERRSKSAALKKLRSSNRSKFSVDEEVEDESGNEESDCSSSDSDSDTGSSVGEQVQNLLENEVDAIATFEDKTTKVKTCSNVKKGMKPWQPNLSEEGPPFLCSCGESFSYLAERNRHYQCKHLTISAPVGCKLCQTQFRNKYAYHSHRVTMNHRQKIIEQLGSESSDDVYKSLPSEGPPFLCLCGKTFIDKRGREKHYLLGKCPRTPSLEADPGFSSTNSGTCSNCPNCLIDADRRELEGTYDYPSSEGERRECVPCQKEFCISGYSCHIKTFEHKKTVIELEGINFMPGPEPFLCETCGNAFHTIKSYNYHKLTRHSVVEGKEICKTCGHKFKTKLALLKHTKNHDLSHICDRCGKRFPTNYKLQGHILYVHERHLIKRKKCPHCEKSFIKTHVLKQHIKRNHGALGEDGRFSCSHCKEIFKTIQDREIHERSVHKGLQNYKCDYCDKLFYVKAFLNQHMVKHTGIKPDKFTCKKCGKKFSSRRGHDQHSVLVCGDDEEAKKAWRKKMREQMANYRKEWALRKKKKNDEGPDDSETL